MYEYYNVFLFVGALSMPRWASLSSIGSGGSSNSANTSSNDQSHNASGLAQSISHQSIASPGGNPSIGKNSNGSGKFKIWKCLLYIHYIRHG